MTSSEVGIIFNGATGRMGFRQHLTRSLIPIIQQGGVELPDGSKVKPKIFLVGRRADRLAEIVEEFGLEGYSTNLAEALEMPGYPIYFDSQITSARLDSLKQAIAAGKHIYTEKPTAESFAEAQELADLATAAKVKNGVVHDKLYLPGLQKLKHLIDSGFFGEILSVRGEFGYWVFEGDWQEAQRPSWNYRLEDGGGIVSDMFAHWNYVIENLFGSIKSVYTQTATHIGTRVDEQGNTYKATADDAAYAIFELENNIIVQLNSSWVVRVNRDELVEFQVDGTLGSAVVGLFGAKIQPRNATPKPVWNPDLRDEHNYQADWIELPENETFDNGFKVQWEEFIRHVLADTEYTYDLAAGARGVNLSEKALQSMDQGQRISLQE